MSNDVAAAIACAPSVVLHRMAGTVLGGGGQVPWSSGTVTLLPAQHDAAQRLLAILRSYGGALLADPAGSGKTYVALAVAAAVGTPMIVAPAALRPMWLRACRNFGIRPLAIVSMESLSRSPPGPHMPHAAALLIVDEAHHARNPATARWRALAELCGRLPCLLLSATPVHNEPRELRAILSLFLGSASEATEMSRVTVRRPLPHDESRPAVVNRGRLRIRAHAGLLDQILALPPPLAPAGNGLSDGAGALAALGLLRAWASSDAALRGVLRRRLTRATAMELLLEQGRMPDRATLAQWIAGDALVQPELPGLFAPLDREASGMHDLRRALSRHAAFLRSMLARLAATRDSDGDRAHHLTRLLQTDDAVRIVAFSHSAETVRALFERMRGVPGVALLTGGGSRVAGGSTSRADVIGRFAPVAHGLRPAGRAHDVRLLLATDILSEGENLQDANVLVHLDLAWTAARMEQRLGRLVRPGSPHRQVMVFTMGAPVPVRRLLATEKLLATKAALARHALGLGTDIGAEPRTVSRGLADAPLRDEHRTSDAERVRLLLRTVLECCERVARHEVPTLGQRAALVSLLECAGGRGWLALVRSNGSHLLVASRDRRKPTSGAREVSSMLEVIVKCLHDADIVRQWAPGSAQVCTALAELRRWLGSRRAASALDALCAGTGSAVARRVLGAARGLVRRAPANRRARLETLLQPLEMLATQVLPVSLEMELERIAGPPGSGSSCWVQEHHQMLADLADRASRRVPPREPVEADRVEALLILDPRRPGCP